MKIYEKSLTNRLYFCYIDSYNKAKRLEGKYMGFELINIQSSQISKMAVQEVLNCNDLSSKFGLVLTKKDATELVQTRTEALKSNGRIEFGGGVIEKIIYEFCDSPYINKQNYVSTLNELVEIFYYYKNETLDAISDDELISYMKKAFNGVCQGSLEILSERELYNLSRKIRLFDDEDEYSETEDEDE